MNQAILISLVAVVVSNVIYHVSQKSVAPNANPLVSTAVSYLVGILVCSDRGNCVLGKQRRAERQRAESARAQENSFHKI